MSLETPDVVNAFSVLAKEDTSHGFPVWRPLERNSDWALYNVNSEGWFQMWSVLAAVFVVSYWFYISNFYFCIASTSVDEEDNIRLKDAKAGLIWERTFWALTFQMHGQHMAALQRERSSSILITPMIQNCLWNHLTTLRTHTLLTATTRDGVTWQIWGCSEQSSCHHTLLFAIQESAQ